MTDCIFCRIVEGKVPAKKIYEDDQCLAFDDINPQAQVHVLVIPKRHIPSLGDMQGSDSALVGHLILKCTEIAKGKALVQSGFRVVANTGEGAGQTVFHLHFHVLGGRRFKWPPG